MAKKASRPKFDYPKPQQIRVGIKVRWNYYANEEDAKKAAEIAKREALVRLVRLSEGYDFGYCSPGVIYYPGAQNFYPDLYEVCLP